jgi:hypothetical protein
MPDIPLALARQADVRALEIFTKASRYDKTFRECLGEIYLIALMAGAEAATQQPEPQ